MYSCLLNTNQIPAQFLFFFFIPFLDPSINFLSFGHLGIQFSILTSKDIHLYKNCLFSHLLWRTKLSYLQAFLTNSLLPPWDIIGYAFFIVRTWVLPSQKSVGIRSLWINTNMTHDEHMKRINLFDLRQKLFWDIRRVYIETFETSVRVQGKWNYMKGSSIGSLNRSKVKMDALPVSRKSLKSL